MKYIGIALIGFGLTFTIGTAGSSDLGLITFEQMVVREILGITALGIGVLLVRIANEIKASKKRKERNK